MSGVDFRIDVAVGEQKIGPAIVVDIDEGHTPAKILRVETEASLLNHRREGAVAVVFVERRNIVGEVGFEDVFISVASVVTYSRSHASLFAAIFVIGDTRVNGDIGEGAVGVV